MIGCSKGCRQKRKTKSLSINLSLSLYQSIYRSVNVSICHSIHLSINLAIETMQFCKCKWLTAELSRPFRHRNPQKCSKTKLVCTFWLANVLLATAARNFSTSELQKVVGTCCVLYILTCKCASRYSGAQFFHIPTSKSGPKLVCFVPFAYHTDPSNLGMRWGGVWWEFLEPKWHIAIWLLISLQISVWWHSRFTVFLLRHFMSHAKKQVHLSLPTRPSLWKAPFPWRWDGCICLMPNSPCWELKLRCRCATPGYGLLPKTKHGEHTTLSIQSVCFSCIPGNVHMPQGRAALREFRNTLQAPTDTAHRHPHLVAQIFGSELKHDVATMVMEF